VTPVVPAGADQPGIDQVASALHISPEFIAPARDVIVDLLTQAQSGAVTDEQLRASAEQIIKAIPDLALLTDISGVADALNNVLHATVAETADTTAGA
jgi:hypothetical protein